MAKKSGENSFANAKTAQELALAILKRLDAGGVSVAETRCLELAATLMGLTAGKIPKSPAPAVESPSPVAPYVPPEEPQW